MKPRRTVATARPNTYREAGQELPVHPAACRDTLPAANSGKAIN